jgi:hypothetical protein
MEAAAWETMKKKGFFYLRNETWVSGEVTYIHICKVVGTRVIDVLF